MKIKYCNHSFVIVLFILFNSLIASANDEFNTESGNYFYLSLNAEVGKIENFLFADKNEQDTAYLDLSPTLNLQTQFQRQLFNLDFESKHRKFQNFSKDDYTDYTLSPRYQYKLSDNKALYINTSLSNLYEMRGTGLTLGNGTALSKGDELERSTISGGYLFGSKDSVAKFKVNAGHYTSKYQTRRDTTYRLDQQMNFVDLSFDYLLSGESYLATNIGVDKINFKYNPLLDKEKYIALVGVKWQTTEISQVALLLGYQQIKFNESSFANDDGFKWRFDFNWHPIYSTRVAFKTERDFEEANRLSDSYRVVDYYNIKITSRFTDFFEAVAVIGSNREEIIYQNSKEVENYLFSNFQLNYQRNEWLSFYVKYDFYDLDSSDIQLNYQRNSISLGFNVSI
jgi:hypothetical protein